MGCGGDDEKIKNLCIKYDKLQSKLDKNDFHYTDRRIPQNKKDKKELQIKNAESLRKD